jgi:hypothetical protein
MSKHYEPEIALFFQDIERDVALLPESQQQTYWLGYKAAIAKLFANKFYDHYAKGLGKHLEESIPERFKTK